MGQPRSWVNMYNIVSVGELFSKFQVSALFIYEN